MENFFFIVYIKISYKLFWIILEYNIKNYNEGFNKLKSETKAISNCLITHLYNFKFEKIICLLIIFSNLKIIN